MVLTDSVSFDLRTEESILPDGLEKILSFTQPRVSEDISETTKNLGQIRSVERPITNVVKGSRICRTVKKRESGMKKWLHCLDMHDLQKPLNSTLTNQKKM
jgi:hypothetical protein